MPAPDIDFLINCCKTAPLAADIRSIQAYASQLEIQQLASITSLAKAHGVFPLVYQALQTHSIELANGEIQAALRKDYLSIVTLNMFMTDELLRITRLLKENDIETLAFKGPALSQLAYGDTTIRQYCDLDILIRKQDIADAISLLKEDDFILEIELNKATHEAFLKCVNVIGLSKKVHVELHWELLSKNYAIDWPEASLWNTTDIITIDQTEISLLNTHTHLLYLCAHGAKHLFERLEWICDIDRLIRTQPELQWPELFEEAQTSGIERMLMLGLYLSHTLLDLPLPAPIKNKVLSNSVVKQIGQQIIGLHFSTTERQGKSYSSFILLWHMRENLPDRLRFAYRALFSPKIDDFKQLELPQHLAFLYPLIRPFRLLFKYFRK